MATKLIWFALSFMGALAAVPAVALLAIFVFKLNFERLLAEHGSIFALFLGFIGVYAAFMFFWLQDVFIVFHPAPQH